MEFTEEVEMYLEVWQKANEQLTQQKKADIENGVTRDETALKRKITGIVTESVIRDHLIKHYLNISERLIYIQGLNVEVDLASLRAGIDPSKRYFYPEEVNTILEIKNTGVANQSVRIRRNFEKIKAVANHVELVTIVLSERRGYKTAITEKEIGEELQSKVYTLLERKRYINPYSVLKREILTNYQLRAIKETGDWAEALELLSRANTP